MITKQTPAPTRRRSTGSVTGYVARACLGILLSIQGEVEGAKAAYRKAIESGYAHLAAMAEEWLSELPPGHGDVEDAKTTDR